MRGDILVEPPARQNAQDSAPDGDEALVAEAVVGIEDWQHRNSEPAREGAIVPE